MLQNIEGGSVLVVTVGAVACMLSMLVLMGLKLRWFRARMTFDQPPKAPETAFVGVYRSTFSDAFDYRRPSELPPLPSHLEPSGASTSHETNGKSTSSIITVNEKKTKAKVTKEPQVQEVKEPKVKKGKSTVSVVPETSGSNIAGAVAVKETKKKEPKVKKEPKATAVKEPKEKAVKEPKEKVAKESKIKEPKPIKMKEPKVAKTKEPKIKEEKVKAPKEKTGKQKKGDASQKNAFPHVEPPPAPPMQGGPTQRVIRNPIAMGAQEYTPPPRGMMLGDFEDGGARNKAWGATAQYLYDMDDESES